MASRRWRLRAIFPIPPALLCPPHSPAESQEGSSGPHTHLGAGTRHWVENGSAPGLPVPPRLYTKGKKGSVVLPPGGAGEDGCGVSRSLGDSGPRDLQKQQRSEGRPTTGMHRALWPLPEASALPAVAFEMATVGWLLASFPWLSVPVLQCIPWGLLAP